MADLSKRVLERTIEPLVNREGLIVRPYCRFPRRHFVDDFDRSLASFFDVFILAGTDHRQQRDAECWTLLGVERDRPLARNTSAKFAATEHS